MLRLQEVWLPKILTAGVIMPAGQLTLKLLYKETLRLYVARQSSKVLLIFWQGALKVLSSTQQCAN